MILASQSPRRLEILRDLGFNPLVVPADVDENPLPDEAPEQLVERLARAKALAAWQSLESTDTDELIIAADTVVWFQDICLGKPADEADARAMLKTLSGRIHHVSTGVCIVYTGLNCAPDSATTEAAQQECTSAQFHIKSFVETSDVEFFELSDTLIDSYLASGEAFDKAGSYGIQGIGRLLVKRIDGDFYTVMGLPIARLMREIQALSGQRIQQIL